MPDRGWHWVLVAALMAAATAGAVLALDLWIFIFGMTLCVIIPGRQRPAWSVCTAS